MGDEAQWDLLRTFDVVVRRRSFTAAAKALGSSQSTVSRHIGLLERQAGAPLFARTTPLVVTERGAALAQAVQPMVEAAMRAHSALQSRSDLRGEVTLTTVGEIARWVLAPRLADLYRVHPQLRLTLLADNAVHSLAANEADLALRMARPTRGELVGRKLATETFGLFAATTLKLDAQTHWLGLGGSLARIAEQRHARRAFAGRAPRLLVEDLETLGMAVEAGLGVAVLPRLRAATLERIVEVQPSRVGAADLGPIPSRSLWLVMHRSKRDLPKVRAVVAWLADMFQARAAGR